MKNIFKQIAIKRRLARATNESTSPVITSIVYSATGDPCLLTGYVMKNGVLNEHIWSIRNESDIDKDYSNLLPQGVYHSDDIQKNNRSYLMIEK
jgi:hypothetical protein